MEPEEGIRLSLDPLKILHGCSSAPQRHSAPETSARCQVLCSVASNFLLSFYRVDSTRRETILCRQDQRNIVNCERNPWDDPDYRKWKDKDKEILRDIEPILFLTEEILHSDRYMDGACITAEDGRAVAEKLLAYHPRSEDKIECGLDSNMVDRHPQFKH